MQESTRFCNYSKGKFNSELTFIIPEWIYDCQAKRASCIDWPTNEPKDWLMEYHGEKMVHIMTTEDRKIANRRSQNGLTVLNRSGNLSGFKVMSSY